MLFAGGEDGAYRFSTPLDSPEATPEKVLDCGQVVRVETFDGLPGVFAASTTGLYHSTDGETWTDLGVPAEKVYSVGARPDGGSLYAGTRPAKVYVTRSVSGGVAPEPDEIEWSELDDFQNLPSREEWRLPRHENLAQVRDVHVHDDAPERVVAGVEVGGVHASEDGGETWGERRDGVNDDVHELHVADAERWAAATGFGLFVTRDAGESWERLDEDFDQRYFRAVADHDGRLYAGAAMANSTTWEDPDADPQFFVSDDWATLEPVDLPRSDETVTGVTAVDGEVVVGTHRGSLFVERDGEWVAAGEIPVPGDQICSYTPLVSFDAS